MTDLRGHVIAEAAMELVGVRYVARGLLEVRHQSAALEDFGENVRDVFTRDVRAAQLSDRVVSILVEHPGVELLGSRRSDSGLPSGVR